MRAALADPRRAPKNPSFRAPRCPPEIVAPPSGPPLTFTPAPPSISQRRNKRRCVPDIQRATILLSSHLDVFRDGATRSIPDLFPLHPGTLAQGGKSAKPAPPKVAKKVAKKATKKAAKPSSKAVPSKKRGRAASSSDEDARPGGKRRTAKAQPSSGSADSASERRRTTRRARKEPTKAAVKRGRAPEAKASAPVESSSSQPSSTEPSFDHNSSDEEPDRRAEAAEAPEAAPVSAQPAKPAQVRSGEKDAYDFDEKTDATEDSRGALETWNIYVRWGNSELPVEVNSACTNQDLKELIRIKTGGRLTPERCKLTWREREVDEYGEVIALADIGVGNDSRLDLFIVNAKAKARTPQRPAVTNAAVGTPEAAARGAAAADNANTPTKQGHVIQVGENGTRILSHPPGAKAEERQKARVQAKKHYNSRWTEEETHLLLEGVNLFGTGVWAKILKWGWEGDVTRNSVDLKDKWRNMVAASQKPPDFKFRSASFTPELLARVRTVSEYDARRLENMLQEQREAYEKQKEAQLEARARRLAAAKEER